MCSLPSLHIWYIGRKKNRRLDKSFTPCQRRFYLRKGASARTFPNPQGQELPVTIFRSLWSKHQADGTVAPKLTSSQILLHSGWIWPPFLTLSEAKFCSLVSLLAPELRAHGSVIVRMGSSEFPRANLQDFSWLQHQNGIHCAHGLFIYSTVFHILYSTFTSTCNVHVIFISKPHLPRVNVFF